MNYKDERETVPCEICGDQTPMTATKRCDRCWELERRIETDPELAKIILQKIESAIGDDKE